MKQRLGKIKPALSSLGLLLLILSAAAVAQHANARTVRKSTGIYPSQLSHPPRACTGYLSCLGATGNIGKYSCTGVQSCLETAGVIGDNSCTGDASCYQASGAIGNNSCTGFASCFQAGVAIGDNSCNTTGTACSMATSPIGDCKFNDVRPAIACPVPSDEPIHNPITLIDSYGLQNEVLRSLISGLQNISKHPLFLLLESVHG